MGGVEGEVERWEGARRILGAIGQESWMCERMGTLIYFIALQGHELE